MDIGKDKNEEVNESLFENDAEIVFLTIIEEQLASPFSRSKKTKIEEKREEASLDSLKQSRYSFREFSKGMDMG